MANLESLKSKCRGQELVFVSGNFNVIHPGHLRLLRFAKECGAVLLVGVHSNEQAGSAALVDEQDRLAGVKANSYVDHAFILPSNVDRVIKEFKPAIVVKGKEHESQFNIEQSIVESYGGRLLFCSGEMQYTSADLLLSELQTEKLIPKHGNHSYFERHQLDKNSMINIIKDFSETKVCVIGDLIVDEYVACEAEGMSREEPTLVVSPAECVRYIGGSAIVAAHAAGLGASVNFVSVRGSDENGDFAMETLSELGIQCHMPSDSSRPTTHKKRYRVGNRGLLRVNHFRKHSISKELQDEVLHRTCELLPEVDVLVLADFNYGMLPDCLVEQLIECALKFNVFISADSQCSSQLGNIARFRGVNLLTPTEHEVRVSLQDSEAGLVVLAERLQQRTGADHVIMTLNRDGLMIHAGENDSWVTDQLPSFNENPVDTSGAGDCLMVTSAMAMSKGSTIWEAVYLGNLAAGIQVGRQGNLPLSSSEIIGAVNTIE